MSIKMQADIVVVAAGMSGLSAAVRYLHAPSSVGVIKDFEQMLTLATAFVDALAQTC